MGWVRCYKVPFCLFFFFFVFVVGCSVSVWVVEVWRSSCRPVVGVRRSALCLAPRGVSAGRNSLRVV